MASGKRLSVWETLRRLGHRGDRDLIVQRVFEAVGSMAVGSPGLGRAFDGDAFLIEVFEGLGATQDWPACGSRRCWWGALQATARQSRISTLDSPFLRKRQAPDASTDSTQPEPLHPKPHV